ncbi:MAG TPA: GTPase Era [Candidatus Ornithomonoglobus intestinigallinarum]|uniref:GTPase Era n=1 Tax=Candidatus Ornithomonoglobus intestinigallinarum TaxID=2840894 RepID=A0A9D1H0V4_9FIRM|nr:GTPase Era [Candidatus Ornithomonoglobus intestinigallinarum]
MTKHFKSGFAAVIGMPNVGKSTLINKIVGQKISIISEKPQTTRNKILAVYTTDEEQIIFTDTPGIHTPHNKLGQFMINVANESMRETDVLIFVVDAAGGIQDIERRIAKNISKAGVPCILVMNKIDAMKKEDLLPMIADYSSMYDFAAIVPISAKTGDGVDILLNNISEYLEDGPMFFDEDTVTDQPERQIAAEIIREKMLWLLQNEVPHGVAIEITKMREKENITNIYATIYCEKAGHKGIIIGKNGDMLKKIGSLARADIEKMLGKHVYLELWVKIKQDWRNSDFLVKNFGYTQSE